MKLDKIMVVVDVEATCCDKGTIPRDETEIIQIGACIVDKKFNIIDEFDRYVKPTVHITLTPFCKQLTKISQQQVDSANGFVSVFTEFSEWMISHNVELFGSWGAYDVTQFGRDCSRHRVLPLMYDTINLKWHFGKENNCKQMGLGRAIEKVGFVFQGSAHSAIVDARNTVRLLPYIFKD